MKDTSTSLAAPGTESLKISSEHVEALPIHRQGNGSVALDSDIGTTLFKLALSWCFTRKLLKFDIFTGLQIKRRLNSVLKNKTLGKLFNKYFKFSFILK